MPKLTKREEGLISEYYSVNYDKEKQVTQLEVKYLTSLYR